MWKSLAASRVAADMSKSSAALVLGLLVVAASPRPASACENEVERRVDVANASVRKAEQLLAEGRHQAVARAVLATFPEALRAEHRSERPALFQRAQRVLALAVVRSGGAVDLGRGMTGRTDRQRAVGLAWAAALLRLRHARAEADVIAASDLAEALARLPAERAEARALLAGLAETDVLPTARAWALLAALEREAGDAAAADRAARRCREIAGEASSQCADAAAA